MFEARVLCCDRWCLPCVPEECVADIEGWLANWHGEKRASKKQRALNTFFKSESKQ